MVTGKCPVTSGMTAAQHVTPITLSTCISSSSVLNVPLQTVGLRLTALFSSYGILYGITTDRRGATVGNS